MKVYISLIPETITMDNIIEAFADEYHALVFYLITMCAQKRVSESLAKEIMEATQNTTAADIETLRNLEHKCSVYYMNDYDPCEHYYSGVVMREI